MVLSKCWYIALLQGLEFIRDHETRRFFYSGGKHPDSLYRASYSKSQVSA